MLSKLDIGSIKSKASEYKMDVEIKEASLDSFLFTFTPNFKVLGEIPHYEMIRDKEESIERIVEQAFSEFSNELYKHYNPQNLKKELKHELAQEFRKFRRVEIIEKIEKIIDRVFDANG